MSANKLAKALKVPANRITTILRGERSVTADTALRLGRFFGTSPEFWMNLQQAYDLGTAKEVLGKTLPKAIRPFKPPHHAT
jgi:addiction module HigA family antidote